MKIDIAREAPGRAGIVVRTHGKYLGIHIGPGSPGKSWGAPLAKYEDRINHLRAQGLGLHTVIMAYHALALSVTLVGQLEDPPTKVLDAEAKALPRLLPGLGPSLRTSTI